MGGTPGVLRWQQPSVTGPPLTPLKPRADTRHQDPTHRALGAAAHLWFHCRDNPKLPSGNSTSGCPKATSCSATTTCDTRSDQSRAGCPGGDLHAPVQPLPGFSPASCSGKGLCARGTLEPWQSSLQVSGCARVPNTSGRAWGQPSLAPALPTAPLPPPAGHHVDTTHSRDRHVAAPLCEASSARSAHATNHKPHRAPCPRTRVSDRRDRAEPVPSPVPPGAPGLTACSAQLYPDPPEPRAGLVIPWAASDTPCTRQTAAANTLVILEDGLWHRGHRDPRGGRELQQHGRLGGEQRRQVLVVSAERGLRGELGLGRASGRLGHLVIGGRLLLFGRGSARGRAEMVGICFCRGWGLRRGTRNTCGCSRSWGCGWSCRSWSGLDRALWRCLGLSRAF